MIRYIAGLDVGGTSGRIRFTGADGRSIGDYYDNGCSLNTAGLEQSEMVYRRLVLNGLSQYGLEPAGCAGICAAASGVDSPELEQVCRDIFINMGFDKTVIVIQNDGEIFLNLAAGPSLVLIAGTGSICYGRNSSGEVMRSGGWNHMLSDEGSAFWMGLEVLRHVGKHLDKQSLCPVLYEEFYQLANIDGLYDLDCFINQNLMDKSAIGKFALLAEHSFQAGEAAGAAIIADGARALAGLVQATSQKLKLQKDDNFCLWLWGSALLKCSPLRIQAEKMVRDDHQMVTIKVPPKAALDIAVDVARKYMKG